MRGWEPVIVRFERLKAYLKPSETHMAMGRNLCLHLGPDEHPCTTYFDVHQGYRVLTHSQIFWRESPEETDASFVAEELTQSQTKLCRGFPMRLGASAASRVCLEGRAFKSLEEETPKVHPIESIRSIRRRIAPRTPSCFGSIPPVTLQLPGGRRPQNLRMKASFDSYE